MCLGFSTPILTPRRSVILTDPLEKCQLEAYSSQEHEIRLRKATTDNHRNRMIRGRDRGRIRLPIRQQEPQQVDTPQQQDPSIRRFPGRNRLGDRSQPEATPDVVEEGATEHGQEDVEMAEL